MKSALEDNGLRLRESVLQKYALFNFEDPHNLQLQALKILQECLVLYFSLDIVMKEKAGQQESESGCAMSGSQYYAGIIGYFRQLKRTLGSLN